ncbi:hypothetical protein [Bradyrhizobium sp. dw_78]|uniref:hypothetical protein n=1 Tax=Bradyrhizobium sp. dw_78 TaxID=2719793 RepID=UPI001BD40620|nr:hypothetical protein [Bradyrhizobium sp. dw_78]
MARGANLFIAFSGRADAGPRQEDTLKQKDSASALLPSEPENFAFAKKEGRPEAAF